MMRRTLGLLLPVLTLACGDPTGGGQTVTVHLTTPNANDGAVAVTITGTGFAEVESANDTYHALSRQETADTLRLLVFGNIGDGPLVRLRVANAARIGAFEGHVTEVARRDNSLEENRAFYRIAFTR